MPFFKHKRAVIHADAKIGDGTRIWANTNIQAGAVIGKECNICDGSFVEGGVVIGNQVTIKHYVSIFNGVTIEDEVFVGSNIAFINDRHPRSRKPFKLEKTLVKKGATIGTNSVIMCGITIGEYAFIGAGAVVLKDVPAYALVVGNPGRMIGYVGRDGHKLDKDLRSVDGQQYKLTDGGLVLE